MQQRQNRNRRFGTSYCAIVSFVPLVGPTIMQSSDPSKSLMTYPAQVHQDFLTMAQPTTSFSMPNPKCLLIRKMIPELLAETFQALELPLLQQQPSTRNTTLPHKPTIHPPSFEDFAPPNPGLFNHASHPLSLIRRDFIPK